MKKTLSFLLLSGLIFFSGCAKRSCGEVWDDSRSCGRYMGQGMRSLGGKNCDSRQIRDRDEFNRSQGYSYQEEDFVPLQDEAGRDMICMEAISQPKFSPGDRGSSIPGIEAFRDPDRDPMLSAVFEHLQFGFDSERVQGQDNLRKIETIGAYMRRNPNTYVFIEGHCDERGPQAYNLALGTKRANSVRTLLVAEGVDPSRLFTVSYGKERPLVQGRDDSSYKINRRAQFKVYDR